MGTDIRLHGENQDSLEEAHAWIWETEQRCSRFLANSELSAINADPTPSTAVSEELASVLSIAQDLRNRTDGLVDIGVGAAVSAWGYNNTFADVQDLTDEPPMTAEPAWTITGRTLTRSAETNFDLGGVAKGWACDRLIETERVSVAAAGGDVSSASSETTIDLVDPWGQSVALIRLGIGALATSSATRRRWKVGQRTANHIIDPRTMSPCDTPIASATVIADTAAEAEAGAKAVLLHGSDGLKWAMDQPWIEGAIAIWYDGNVYATPSVKGRLA